MRSGTRAMAPCLIAHISSWVWAVSVTQPGDRVGHQLVRAKLRLQFTLEIRI